MSEIKYVDSVALKTFWELAKKKMLDLVYPVGSVYMSFNNTYPGALFGGNWQPIEGQFLLAADSTHKAGDMGNGKLEQKNIPEFTGNIRMYNGPTDTTYGTVLGKNSGGNALTNGVFSVGGDQITSYIDVTTKTSTNLDLHDRISFNLGKADPDPIYPPYIAVYMWQRVKDNTTTFVLDESKLDDTTQILA